MKKSRVPGTRNAARRRGQHLFAALLAGAMVGLTGAASAVPIAQTPLYAGSRVPGNLAIVPSVEFPTLISVANFGDYDPQQNYVGYFDSRKCYRYVWDAEESKRHFYPVGWAPANHACPNVTATSGDPGDRWSGNFMNWSATQTIDPFRSALTGGYRVSRGEGLGEVASETWLEKAISDRPGNDSPTANFPRRNTPSSNSNATLVSNATPVQWGNVRTRIDGLGNRMWFTSATETEKDENSSYKRISLGYLKRTDNQVRYPAHTGDNGVANLTDSVLVPYNPAAHVLDNSKFPNNNNAPRDKLKGKKRSLAVYEVSIRVAVCVRGLLESNCVAYGENSKPEGLIQEYSDRIRFSIFGYLNNGTEAEADGGVMRARQKFVGPMTYYPESGPQSNTNAEWNSATGVLVRNPDPSDATATNAGVLDSGVINYLNKFGQMNTGRAAKSYDNVGELFYTATRYFRGLGFVPAYNRLSSISSNVTRKQWADGFPVIDWGDEDPVRYQCQANVILGIGDTNTWRDKNLPGVGISTTDEPARPAEVANDNTVDVVQDLHRILAMEGDAAASSRARGSTFSGSEAHRNSGYIAALAYAARTRDVRPDMAGMQTISSYWVDVVENRDYKTRLTNQYWLLGKYGGFTVPSDFDPDFDPTSSAEVPSLPDSAWASGENVVDGGNVKYKRPRNFYVAAGAAKMVESLRQAFANIVDEMVGSGGGFASNTTVLETGAMTFQARFRVDGEAWSGDLQAFDVDPETGALTATWTAASNLPAWASRNIWINSGTFKRFDSYASLSGAHKAELESQAIVDYLRGHRADEQPSGSLRRRTAVLGDIVNSEPVYVGAPNPRLYIGSSFQGAASYQNFAADSSGRRKMVYVGANDGMLHGFDATTGAEVFAFIPSGAVNAGLGDYAKPGFQHRYFVDGELTVADVYDAGSSKWKTVLVGTLGRGGRGIFALDVTDPESPKFLWEYSGADISALGNNLGKPIIAQVADGDWRVFLGNGPNSTSGVASLVTVGVFNGTRAAIGTGAGDDNGLSGVNVWSSTPGGFSDTVYAGDLKGNLWKYHLSTNSFTKLFEAGASQPISGTPLVSRRPGTSETWIFFGTGRYLNEVDLSDDSVQTWYGLIDRNDLVAKSSLREMSILVEGEIDGVAVRGIEQDAAVSSGNGWYMDLVSPVNGEEGERMVIGNRFRGRALIGTTRIPDAVDPCSPSGRGFIMAVDPFSGGRLPGGSFFDVDGDGSFGETIGEPPIPVSGIGTPSGPNNPIFIGNIMQVSLDDTTSRSVETSGQGLEPERVSWRELIGN